MKTKYINKNQGITLLTLVITIIIVIIIAGVSINSITGSKGIINQTRITSENSERAKVEEIVDVAYLEVLTKNGGAVSDDIAFNAIKQVLINGGYEVEQRTLKNSGGPKYDGVDISEITDGNNELTLFQEDTTLLELNLRERDLENVNCVKIEDKWYEIIVDGYGVQILGEIETEEDEDKENQKYYIKIIPPNKEGLSITVGSDQITQEKLIESQSSIKIEAMMADTYSIGLVIVGERGEEITEKEYLTIKVNSNEIPATQITIASNKTIAEPGEKISFKKAIMPADSTDKRVSWNATGAGTIDEQGVLTVNANAQNGDTINVTATCLDANNQTRTNQGRIVKDTKAISVVVHASSIKIYNNNPSDLDGEYGVVLPGDSVQLMAEIAPVNNADSIKWSVTGSATINEETGKVQISPTAKNNDVIVVTAQCMYNGEETEYRDGYTFTVIEHTKVQLSTNENLDKVYSGTEIQFFENANPSNHSDEIRWSVTGNAQDLGDGRIKVRNDATPGDIIKVKVECFYLNKPTGQSDEITITVKSKYVYATGLSIESTGNVSSVEIGQPLQMISTVTPSNSDDTLTWEITGNATISSTGMVDFSGCEAGDVITISCKTIRADETPSPVPVATKNITVKQPAYTVTIVNDIIRESKEINYTWNQLNKMRS